MASRLYVPTLKNKNIIIRIAETKEELDAANKLVCDNYLSKGLFSDAKVFYNNEYIHSPARIAVIALDGKRVIATSTLIRDTQKGLRLESFRPEIIKHFRAQGDYMGELTALAVDPACQQQRDLVLFLFKYLYQYSFYYEGMDRLLLMAARKHAVFYDSVCCLKSLSPVDDYSYLQVKMKLMTLPLLQAHLDYYERYEAHAQTRNNFYRFMLIDPDPNLLFPSHKPLVRPRNIDWCERARAAQEIMAVAV